MHTDKVQELKELRVRYRALLDELRRVTAASNVLIREINEMKEGETHV